MTSHSPIHVTAIYFYIYVLFKAAQRFALCPAWFRGVLVGGLRLGLGAGKLEARKELEKRALRSVPLVGRITIPMLVRDAVLGALTGRQTSLL